MILSCVLFFLFFGTYLLISPDNLWDVTGGSNIYLFCIQKYRIWSGSESVVSTIDSSFNLFFFIKIIHVIPINGHKNFYPNIFRSQTKFSSTNFCCPKTFFDPIFFKNPTKFRPQQSLNPKIFAPKFFEALISFGAKFFLA